MGTQRINFVGEWDEESRTIAIEQLLEPGFSPEDLAHGVVLLDGVFRFVRDPLIDDLFYGDALNLNAAWRAFGNDPDLSRLRALYRRLGYSICGYRDVFWHRLFEDEDD